ncbi:MAG: GNAT family N-acetyltransferase [Paenisporosarcina sp.]
MRIRNANLADIKGIAKVHVDSWKTTYENIISEDFLNNLSYESREKVWKTNMSNMNVYVAENAEGDVVGFSTGGKERSGNYDGINGELYAIYILKEYQGQGLGRMLVKPVIDELLNLGIKSMLVLVLEKNSSFQFYEALGARQIEIIEVEIAGDKQNEIVYGWDDIKAIQL